MSALARAAALVLAFCVAPAGQVFAEPLHIVVATWRGCEEACRGVQDHFRDRNLDVRFTVIDAAQQRDRLAGIASRIRMLGPDLVITWGTTVSVDLLGRMGAEDDELHVTDIPAVFMIVADPVGAGLVADPEVSGRAGVTGTRNRVPEIVQIRAMRAYRPLRRLGLIYNPDEPNAVLKAAEIRALADGEDFELVEFQVRPAAGGSPSPEDIDLQIERAAAANVDFLYVASSSFLMAHRDRLTAAARDAGIALASAYEAMVQDSHGLLTMAARYYNVGRLAGFQAEQILLAGADPATMPIRGLDRYSYIINMETARRLELYPPLQVLRYAEIVNGRPTPAMADSGPPR